jgi:hypothetical protein
MTDNPKKKRLMLDPEFSMPWRRLTKRDKQEIADAAKYGLRPCLPCRHCGEKKLCTQRECQSSIKWICDECWHKIEKALKMEIARMRWAQDRATAAGEYV